MTRKHFGLLIAVMAALFITATEAVAQTCRISVGVSSSGVKHYKEVYEYDFVEEKPSFPGGDAKLVEFINSHRHYPKEAYRKGIQGRVTCSFVVESDGEVSCIRVIRSVDSQLDAEATRILKLMPEWIPGRISGLPVPVRVIWSVPFRK